MLTKLSCGVGLIQDRFRPDDVIQNDQVSIKTGQNVKRNLKLRQEKQVSPLSPAPLVYLVTDANASQLRTLEMDACRRTWVVLVLVLLSVELCPFQFSTLEL